ncbi:MAG: RloB family protein [Saprospiraceae bacterium]
MANKNKHNRKPSFQDFVNSLKRTEIPREIGDKAEWQYFLIVTEGEKTEPNYFNGLTSQLPNHLVQVEILGEGANTVSVVKAAIQKRKEQTKKILQPNFDEVWVVFDKDDFPAENFNGAIQLANSKDIQVAYSNEAFELWYILHFQYLDAAINRNRYIEILKDILGEYRKNDENMYALLQAKGDENRAILWAEKLYETLFVDNPALEKPTTLVHLLVQRLNEFKE